MHAFSTLQRTTQHRETDCKLLPFSHSDLNNKDFFLQAGYLHCQHYIGSTTKEWFIFVFSNVHCFSKNVWVPFAHQGSIYLIKKILLISSFRIVVYVVSKLFRGLVCLFLYRRFLVQMKRLHPQVIFCSLDMPHLASLACYKTLCLRSQLPANTCIWPADHYL